MEKNYTRCKRWCSYLLLLFGALLISFISNAQLLEVDGNPADWEYVLNNPDAVKAVSFVVDLKTAEGEDNQFTTGAKDYSAAPDMGWSWSQVNDKNELTNAAVAIIEENGQRNMYFFTDRFSTNGSAEVGFWVFQNGTAPREPEMDFYPEKEIGDLLILATFTNGGEVDDIELYQYMYPGNAKEAKFDKLTSTPGVNACAFVSKPSLDQTIASQNAKGDWYYDLPNYSGWEICNKEAKDCERYYDGAFFEGCINLTWLENEGFKPIKLCGGTFLMETRESHKLSSAVNDFIGGSLNYEFEITATDQTVCEDPDGGLVDVNLCALTKEGGTDFLPGTTFKWYYNEDNALNDENPVFGESFRCTGEGYLKMPYSTTLWVVGTDPDGCASAPVPATLTIEPRPELTDGSLTVCEDVAGEGVGTFDLEDAALLAAMGLDPSSMSITYDVPGGTDLNNFKGKEGDEVDVTAFINGYTLDCQSSAKIVLHVEPRPVLIDGSLTVCEDVAGEGVGTFDLENAANLAAMGLDPLTMEITYDVPGGSDLNNFEGEEGDEVAVTAFIKGYTLDCQSSAKIVLHVEPRPVLQDGSLTECEDEVGVGVGTFNLEDPTLLATMGLDPSTMTIEYSDGDGTIGTPGSYNASDGDEVIVTAFINGYTLDCQTQVTIILNVEPRPVIEPVPNDLCANKEGPTTDIEICIRGLEAIEAGALISWFDNSGLTEPAVRTSVLGESLEDCYVASITEPATEAHFWVIAVNADGCISEPVHVVASVNPNPECIISSVINTTNEGGNNGEMTALLTSPGTGTFPGDYTIEWTAIEGTIGAIDPTNPLHITGLTKGHYQVKITDAEDCWTECDAELLSNPICSVEGSLVPCKGDLGTVNVSLIEGLGAPPFDFYLLDAGQNIVMQALDVDAWSYTFENVPVAKGYLALVVDADGLDTDCGPVDVDEPPLLQCEILGTTNTLCDQSTGSVSVNITGGTPGEAPDALFWYSLENLLDEAPGWIPVYELPFGIGGLAAGDFTVYVKDVNNCRSDCPFTIGADPCPCETAFGYGEDQDITGVDIISRSFLDDCTPAGPWTNWGWTNYIPALAEGNTFYFPMYAGAPVCDPSPEYDNHIVGTAVVEYYSGEVSITFTDLKAGYTFDGFHIWTGDTPFPPKNAPGQWTAGTNFDFDGGYIVIHAVYCGPSLPAPLELRSAQIPEPVSFEESDLVVYPNPFSDKVTFEFVSGKDAHGVLELYNIFGQRVARIMDRQVLRGELNRIEYEPENKVTGIYLYRLELDGDIQIGRVIYKE